MVIDETISKTNRETIRLALEEENIESRPIWKPMHMQGVFKGCEMIGGAVSEWLFQEGLCLPSGSLMSDASLARICEIIRRVAK